MRGNDHFTGKEVDAKDLGTISLHIELLLSPTGERYTKSFDYSIEKTTRNMKDNPTYKKIMEEFNTLVATLDAAGSKFEVKVDKLKKGKKNAVSGRSKKSN